jgi:DNA-binding IclR family transcriptional regulator
MTRTSPGTQRTIAVLNFFAATPETWFSLSEVARRLNLNKATSHALLAELADCGFLIRHPDKTYSLGPAAVALGVAAGRLQYRVLERAKPEMEALSERFDADCTAITVSGQEAVVLDRTGPGRSTAEHGLGQRTPLALPLGGIYVAWSSPDVIAAWAGRHFEASEPSDGFAEVLDSIRANGYAVGLARDARVELSRAIQEIHQSNQQKAPVRELVERLLEELAVNNYTLLEIDDDQTYNMGYITAPIFDSDSRVILTLSLMGFSHPETGREVRHMAKALQASTNKVTRAINGRFPKGFPAQSVGSARARTS